MLLAGTIGVFIYMNNTAGVKFVDAVEQEAYEEAYLIYQEANPEEREKIESYLSGVIELVVMDFLTNQISAKEAIEKLEQYTAYIGINDLVDTAQETVREKQSLDIANDYFDEKKYADAMKYYRKVLGVNNQNSEAWDKGRQCFDILWEERCVKVSEQVEKQQFGDAINLIFMFYKDADNLYFVGNTAAEVDEMIDILWNEQVQQVQQENEINPTPYLDDIKASISINMLLGYSEIEWICYEENIEYPFRNKSTDW